MNSERTKPTPTSENSTTTILRKLAAVACFIFAALGVFMLVKTELRKWFTMNGDATSANTALFWISLLWTAILGFAGSKLWHIKKRESNDGSS